MPSDKICIDEILEKFYGRCSFRVYMKNKPSKYGIKIYAASNVKSYYTFNLEIYCRKQPPAGGQISTSAKDVVLHLTEDIAGSGRNITTDNFYTSMDLARELMERKLTLLGTVRKNKAFIPKSFLNPQEYLEKFQSMFGFTDMATLVCCYNKNKKVVPLLSTLPQHNAANIGNDSQKKPIIILDYNKTKGAVDHVDRLKVNYQLAKTSRRCLLTLFFGLLNIGVINVFILLN